MELDKLIEKTKEILKKSEIAFMDDLEGLFPEFDQVITMIEEQNFLEEQKENLKDIQKLHNEVLQRAEDIINRKGELITAHKKTAKGIKAYIDKYPKRISAFSKRKG